MELIPVICQYKISEDCIETYTEVISLSEVLSNKLEKLGKEGIDNNKRIIIQVDPDIYRLFLEWGTKYIDDVENFDKINSMNTVEKEDIKINNIVEESDDPGDLDDLDDPGDLDDLGDMNDVDNLDDMNDIEIIEENIENDVIKLSVARYIDIENNMDFDDLDDPDNSDFIEEEKSAIIIPSNIEVLKPWEKEFISNIDKEKINELIKLSEYLKINELTNLCCKYYSFLYIT